MRGAVDRRRVLELLRDRLEEAAQQPDREGERERRIGDDQRGVRVEQAEIADDDEERDDQQDMREHLRDEEEEAVGIAAGEADARQRIGGVHRTITLRNVEIAATLKLFQKYDRESRCFSQTLR